MTQPTELNTWATNDGDIRVLGLRKRKISGPALAGLPHMVISP
jgi:hypothetical protein